MDKKKEVKLPRSVSELLEWKNQKSEQKDINWPVSVEKQNEEEINSLGWDKTESLCVSDTLYSFLSIYSIGVWFYNKDKCLAIKPKMKKIYINIPRISKDKKGKGSTSKSRPLCSAHLLSELQKSEGEFKDYQINVEELNKVIQPFIDVYFELGNTSPIWPAGNQQKGNQNLGFMDIPELYFHQFKSWYEILCKAYPNASLDKLNVDEQKYESLYMFLSSLEDEDAYAKYIDYVVKVINNRNSSMKKEIEKID